MDKKPLVRGSVAVLEELKPQDNLDDEATGLVSKSDFNRLETKFKKLLEALSENGIELPDELCEEMNSL